MHITQSRVGTAHQILWLHRLGGFWDGLCREGFLEQIIR